MKLLFITLFLLIISLNPSFAENNSSSIDWPLPLLDYEERAARLTFFLERSDLVVDEMSDEILLCTNLLSKLERQEYEILKAEYTSRNKTDYIRGLVRECKDIDVTEYDVAGGCKFSFTANFEVYDLSKYTDGKPVKGLFAEGGIYECPRASELFEMSNSLVGYKKYGGVIGSVFNTESCEQHIKSRLPMNHRISAVASSQFNYREFPNTFLFAEISDDLYRIAISVTKPWTDFAGVLDGAILGFSLDKISDTQNLTCNFKEN